MIAVIGLIFRIPYAMPLSIIMVESSKSLEMRIPK